VPLSNRFRITIPMKVALLVLTTVLVSVLAFASYIFFKVKQEEEKSFAHTVANLGVVMGEQLWRAQEDIKKDMTNILALINPVTPAKGVESIRVILQKNPQLLYFEVAQIESEKEGHKELLSIYNENALVKGSVDRNEITLQIERDLNDFARRKENEVNYHFSSLPEQFPIYIFELDIKKGLYVAFALTKNAISQFHNPTSPVDVVLLNGQNQVLYSSSDSASGESPFPVEGFLKFIETRPSNQGTIERFRGGNKNPEFATHFYRAADGVLLVTYKNLESAGLAPRTFIRDVILFCGVISAIMLLMSLGFSTGLSTRIKKLMGLTENIAAGNYNVSSDLRSRDEVGDLADYFRVLGERLGEKDTHMEKVTEMANRDGLTGVYNRRYFRERLEELFESSRESGRPLALILLDIDHYKRFNDEYGHQQGDIVIQQLAHLLLTLTRKSDLVARYGGDEFAVVLVNTDLKVSQHIAERIRDAFQHKRITRLGSEGTLSGTVSLGVANTETRAYTNADELIAVADDHLYKSKRNGRNQVFSGANPS
jgi:diguanylate cyclase (GGDEF)-like protein